VPNDDTAGLDHFQPIVTKKQDSRLTSKTREITAVIKQLMPNAKFLSPMARKPDFQKVLRVRRQPLFEF
jgi:hypothetical protein